MSNDKFKIFDMDYFDIRLVDFSDDGGIVICHDPKHRCKDEDCKVTWAVVITFSNKDAPPKALGLFWDKEKAIRFANVAWEET